MRHDDGLKRHAPAPRLEVQSGRCPICNRTMVALMKRGGLGWLCGCPEKPPRRAGPSKSLPPRMDAAAAQSRPHGISAASLALARV